MKLGKSKSTGHMVEFRPCKGKDWREKHWDFEQKKFMDDGPALFAYCVDCEQWGWAWEDICPKNSEVVLVRKLVAK